MSTQTTEPMFRALSAAVQANVPTLIWSAPGQGKTAKIEAAGEQWGREVRTIAASSREAVDFMGLPIEKNGRVEYSPLSWALDLNKAKKGLLVVDEITTAASTFKAFLRIVQERYVGELKLADSVSIVALANPPEIAVDGIELPAPVANRFMHLNWVFDREEWLDNVGTGFKHTQTPNPSTYLTAGTANDRAKASALVVGFLKHAPQMLNDVPDTLEAQGGAWPSARSWTHVIDVLTWVRADDLDVRDLVVKGLVGEGAWRMFTAYTSELDLPDPQNVLDDPLSIDWDTLRPDVAFLTLQSVRDLVLEDGGKQAWENGCTLASHVAKIGKPDISLPLALSLTSMPWVQDGVGDDFVEAFSDLMLSTGRIQR